MPSAPIPRTDCIVLWLPGQRADWRAKCDESLRGEPVAVHPVQGIPGDYPRARCESFKTGSLEFVSYVDPDDYVMPGAFEACTRLLDTTGAVMAWTDCLAVWEDDPLSRARRVTPRRPHQLIVARRWAVEHAAADGPVSDSELWRRVGAMGVGIHLPIIGYVWRDHPLTRQQREARCFAAS